MAISAPEKKSSAGVYSYLWKDTGIRIVIDHISENKSGQMAGEIAIDTTAPGVAPHIHWTRLTLNSTSSREEVIRTCKKRAPDIDWDAIIEQVCVLTMERHRQGEPVLPLGSKPEYTSQNYRVYPLLLEGESNLLYAPGKTGKSYIALYLACLIQYNVVGIYNWIPAAGNVLVLDYETSYRSYMQRTWAIKQGLGIEDETQRILYRRCYQPLSYESDSIRKLVIDNKIDFIIVDSAGYAAGGDPNDASIALSYYAALNSYKVTSLTLDHVSKNSIGEKTPFGSVYKTNSARNVWELQKNQETDQKEYDLGLYHRAINDGILLRPIGYKASFTNNDDGIATKVEFNSSNIADNPVLSKGLSLADRITNYLINTGKAEVKEIAASLEADENQVKARLNENKKKFIHVEGGWGVLKND